VRRPLSALLLLFIVTAATIGTSARAGPPSPQQSTVDECLLVCPRGDMILHVVVRDLAANPIANSTVSVDFCACAAVVLCPSPGFVSGIPGCVVVAITDAAGVADLPIRAGGVCDGGVNIFADGVLLASRGVASPDQDGDADVDAGDQAILAAALPGPYQTTADLDCSLTLDAHDADVQSAHLGHSCAPVVPVRTETWGRVKIVYR